ncbi:nucleotide sugar dehydrogenase [Pseudobacteroides cellulosolvens ATCC 35603 = DSM 2933]|uniref:Nucleotide sugar dehydrogenase n=1 Tax=Pseudobacteroides cellulosolvens ATCC 35603 = DSM 2933 TaxID=398512 RepID=A0A0L6JL96_9FIRM|nr:nucleotide sugar dehydrogenase [Pseudobacteroides cellulosolvens ATCC 35603 = DSM 2933]
MLQYYVIFTGEVAILRDLFERIRDRKEKISVVGLGYVGLPLAVSLSEKADVIGFDISEKKIESYKQGIDVTKEVGSEKLKNTKVQFTCNEEDLKSSSFIIVAVPTPIAKDKTPDLFPVRSASEIVGRNLCKGAIVVYESTVYPGVTEDVCVPILEKCSGLKCGIDFKVGYSPERINPGDKVHTVENITKIVSGMDDESLQIIANVYELIIKAGVYRAESIKVAEAAKVIENTQRDLNIAFMNELSIVFNKMGIDTLAVLKAAGTKWNFLKFSPGLVGGHCIGVDPYYLTYKSEELGYHPQVILAGRRINDGMGKYIAENTVKLLIKNDVQIKGSKVLVMGITFKENVPDVRNSKVIDIVNELKEYGIDVSVTDSNADVAEVKHEYGIDLVGLDSHQSYDAIVVAVNHNEYGSLTLDDLKKLYRNDKYILVDVKGLYDREEAITSTFSYWRL